MPTQKHAPDTGKTRLTIPVSASLFCTFSSKKTNPAFFQTPCQTITFSYSCSYSFTGKELDPETGYSYFGARYLDHTPLTLWLSVDPMADKYPSISPYAYCAWNPLKLVDPNGDEIWIIGDDGNSYQYREGRLYTKDGNLYEGKDAFAIKIKNCLNDIAATDEGLIVISQIDVSKEQYTYKNEGSSNPNAGGGFSENNLSIKVKNSDYGSIAHETFHAYQHDCGMRSRTNAREVGAYLFQALMIRANSSNERWGDCGMWLAVFQGSFNYFAAMNELIVYGFDEKRYQTALNLFFSESKFGTEYKGLGYEEKNNINNPPIQSILQK